MSSKRLKNERKSVGPQCAAYGCTNAFYKNPDLNFFSFPSDKSKQNRWCNLIKRRHGHDGFYITRSTVVCSSHFSEKDIYKTLTGIKKLKKDAEPSLGHQWSKPKDTNKRALPKSREVEILDKRTEDIVTSCNIEEDVEVPVENIDNMEDYQENSQDELIKELRMQVDGLQKQVQSLNDECQYHKSKYFSLEKYKDDDNAISFYTGFENHNALVAFYRYLEPKVQNLQYWKDLVRRNMPAEFNKYPTTRVVLDCTEVFIEKPSAMIAQSQTWSQYKHHNTWKLLVGVSPNGQVTFVSEAWGGKASDKQITKECGILNLVEAGDNLMVDRGFEIDDIVPLGVKVNMPPFLGSRSQMAASETEQTMRIASVRIHVERVIQRIKSFHILDGTLPNTMAPWINHIFSVCARLTNFWPPLLPPANLRKS
ncbi:uncharacterized protein LOC116294123 [Actinia tenebrosa]|uniref:Uncharacterized protein LOC116294123 n=1 Tax=Actinia tenebrosa TaxID=6105 RepID=A0A6P8HPI2_ACTTE|nr:uncharacterized protein LOC116294123 [Actinia tenebrosa]